MFASMRLLYFSLTLCLSAALGAAALPGPAGLLESLSTFKDFKAKRQSSFDPSGGNRDGRQDLPIKSGETREMAVIEGAGAITHIWVTIASPDPKHLKNLALRMYWDGETSPSVAGPIGDFFGLGNGQYYQYSCLPIQIGTNNGLNCFWRMPFAQGARVTVTNEGPQECRAFYYYVDYQVYKSLPKDRARFHAQYRQAYPCTPGENYVLLEAEGRGHYVGCNLSIHNRADGWWGEGDDMIYVDGEAFPSLHGTGSEDYFCGAWCYGPAFSDLYLGCPLRGEHKTEALWNVYRYHIEDPIPFEQRIRVTIEHGHANDRHDDFSSMAYWYQDEPHAAFPALPPAEERWVAEVSMHREENATEMEDLTGEFMGGPVGAQDLSNFGEDWSHNSHAWFTAEEPTTYEMIFDASGGMAGSYTAEIWYTRAPDYGLVELWMNGAKMTAWDGYDANGVTRAKLSCPITLADGANTLEVRITGKNPASSGFYAGIDCFRQTPVQQ